MSKLKNIAKPNITGRRFVCISVNEDPDEIGDWSNNFTIGETYLELKTDVHNENWTEGIENALLLQDNDNIGLYADANCFIEIEQVSEIIVNNWLYLN